ncbi:MAG: hypothetical protein NZ895_06470 [Archaeoglobaceae archaeon]|nr:hypothetical protein [Archaeoglobaceae archaeon]MCX8152301.1 hypothetical protein [Archaeoglobaceae archaeon]MDW8013979.1 hypothetical protein [Archaeoglobaceae archaeon]
MKNNGFSIILEYIIIASILTVFVAVLSLSLNSVLEQSQIARVVENQFSDVSAQISSQIVDMLAVYPKNGNLSARVFMPQKIGNVKYTVVLEDEKIRIVSEDGRFSKHLSLGSLSEVGVLDLAGLTHSLKEHHELVYQKISCIYPTAVLDLNKTSIIVPETVEIDVSSSSPGSAESFEWRIIWWNGTNTSWYDSRITTSLQVPITTWKAEFEQNCKYNSSANFSLCNITLEVKTYCEGENLNSTTKKIILIAKPESEGYGNITIDKFAASSQVEVGQITSLHIRLDSYGVSGEKTVNLTTVLSLDSSGSMGDLRLVPNNNPSKILELSTMIQRFLGFTDNNKVGRVNLTLSTDLPIYSFIVAEIPSQYSGFEVSRIGNKNCPQNCICTSDRKICYVTNLTPGNLEIEVKGKNKSAQFEVLVYLAKIDSLKLSAISYLKALKDGDFAGLVEYDDVAIVKPVNSTQYLKNLTTNKRTVIEEVKKMKADGATNIYHALWKANQTLHENTTITAGTVPLIILMTDGWPTVEAHLNSSSCSYYCRYYDNDPDWDCPLENWWFSVDGIGFCRYGNWCRENCYVQIEQLANEIKRSKIGGQEVRICTIGFGRDGEYNATLLRNIASYINETTKCFFEARNHEQLQNAFRTIKSYFDIVATNVLITDVLPSYVQIAGKVEVKTSGAPVCNDRVNITKDQENRTQVQFRCSEMRIGDSVEIVIPISFEQVGTYILNVPKVSNVTYNDVSRNLVVVPLEVVSVRYGYPGSAKVMIR